MILPQRKLGATDLVVSALGLGTVKLGRNTDVKYPHDFVIPDDKQAADLLAMAKDLNINLLDTAPAYGNSELLLGKLLQQQRHDWVIVGKAGEEYQNNQSTYDFSPAHIMNSIHNSLRNLRTDYLDVLLIHSNGDDEHIINQFDVFNTLEKAKQQGLIRYSGMSTKTVKGGLLTLQNSDIAMVTYNPTATEELPVIQAAQQLNKGILIKKALASGHLNKISTNQPVQTAFDFIFQQAGVSSVILGTINARHLTDNVTCACEALCVGA